MGCTIIREGNLVYICTGSIKKKLEAGQKNDLNQGSITQIIKRNQLSLVLNGDMVAGIYRALPIGIGMIMPGNPQDVAIMAMDKIFFDATLGEGKITSRQGFTFRSGANLVDILSSIIRTWPILR